MRVVVAMSGGVDSSVAAALTLQAGHDVIGMTMSLYDASGSVRKGRGGTCCSPAEVDLARRACEVLGVPHYTVDERALFQEKVIDDFAREYAAGRTPNPCARCNEHVKFTPLWQRAKALGAERLVTGHYARIEQGQLHRGLDDGKDQSYFLFAMGREALAHVDFPLGGWTKDRVREHARSLGLPNADARDSQELCFVADGNHGRVVEARARALGLDESSLAPGEIRDADGNVLGTHRGIHRVTVGQRRGLGLSGVDPRYVLRVLPDQRAVVVGDADALAVSTLEVRDMRWLIDAAPTGQRRVQAQFRHRSNPAPGTARWSPEGVTVTFDAPQRAAAPGQAVVLYDDDLVLGGGWLERAE